VTQTVIFTLILFLGGCLTGPERLTSQPARIPDTGRPVLQGIGPEKPDPVLHENTNSEKFETGKPNPQAIQQSVRTAISSLPAGKKPVLKNGKPLFFTCDIDADGNEDLFILTVTTPHREKTDFAYLSDFRRLFDPGDEEITFHIMVFLRKSSGVTPAKIVQIGTGHVLAAFEEIPFRSPGKPPFGMSLIFPTAAGREHVWIIFSSLPRHTVFKFQERADVKAFIHDIDGNGIIDLLLFEDVFEDSTGYETYITWHRWDGTTYRKHRTTNIVRNLKNFFETSKEFLLSGNLRQFLTYSLTPKDAALSRTLGIPKTLSRILKPVFFDGSSPEIAEYSDFDPDLLKNTISDVVYPEVFENPFTLRENGPDSFPLTIRVTADEENYFFTARLAMNINPFGGKMFHFILE
jgi:hypothetical protein